MSLRIFGICRYLPGCIHTRKGQTCNLLTNPAGEIGLIKNTTTQVITTVNIVTYIGETLCERAVCIHLPTHVGLSMTKDISITRTTKGLVDTPLAKINNCVTTDRT